MNAHAGSTPWDALRACVLASPDLLRRLRATPDEKTFIDETVRVATELNLPLTAAEAEEALCAARREFIERWC